MLYIVHDFFKNFLSAVNAEDTLMLADLITDETAKIIVFDRGKIIEIIRKSKIKTSSNPTDADIINALIKNISKNKDLNNLISDLIIKNNTDKNNIDNKETVPADKRKEFVKKALSMFINSDNEMLIKKKTAHHLKVRDMNFNADAEVIDLTKKQKVVIVTRTVFVTTVMLGIGYLVLRTLIKKGVFKKKETAQTEVVQTTEVTENTES